MKTSGIDKTSAFRGNNFMTPDVLEYRSGEYRGTTVHVEISRGRGFYGDPIFGISLRKPDGTRLNPDVSTVLPTLRAVNKYLSDLGEEDEATP